MADAIKKNYDDYEGFVILHGTDTMVYTASAFEFYAAKFAKPVYNYRCSISVFV